MENPMCFEREYGPPSLSPAARRAVEWACEYAETCCEPATGFVLNYSFGTHSPHASLLAGLAFLLSGEPERVQRAQALLTNPQVYEVHFAAPVIVVALKKAGPVLDEEVRDALLSNLERFDTSSSEDIIAGRNINIPLHTWTCRIAQGVLFNLPEQVGAGVTALAQLTDLVQTHGTIPEFNCPGYHGMTLIALRAIVLLDEPRTAALAAALERHLWAEMAWRYNPRLRVLGGPWGRAYHGDLVGGTDTVQLMLHIAWGALFDPAPGYAYQTAHAHTHGGLLPLMLDDFPFDVTDIALRKALPVAVCSSAEQAMVLMGDEEHTAWVPGGIAELTTWMDENTTVGTANRSHVHGMQNATYLAQWSRTGKPVETLDDLGQAFTRFIMNRRRPGAEEYVYPNHHVGRTFTIGKAMWADDGRPFALQSGPTALVAYIPKEQERWTVQTLEMMLVVPRLSIVDAVLVDGQIVEEYEGSPNGSVVVRSGLAALGARFAVCDPELTAPRLIVERTRDHVLVGLHLATFEEPRELSRAVFRRYGGAMGLELRFAQTQADLDALVADMAAADLSDTWHLAVEGGPRVLQFRVGDRTLYGRFDPISESWLARKTPPHPGYVKQIQFEEGLLAAMQ
jgi:hypothetical protein